MSCGNGQKMSKEEYESFVKKGSALVELMSVFIENTDIDKISSRIKSILEDTVNLYYPNHPGYPEVNRVGDVELSALAGAVKRQIISM